MDTFDSGARPFTRLAPLFFALTLILGFTPVGTANAGDKAPPSMSEGATEVEHDASVFKADPTYEDKPYSVEEQLKIYGDKRAIQTPRPLLELGREIYVPGPYLQGGTALGELNPTYNAFAIYGDWKTAVGYNDNGDAEIGQIATQLNLQIDYQFTGTERLHAFVQPLNQGADFTRCEFAGDNDEGCEEELNGNLKTFFFEGDIGSIWSGFTGEYNDIDLAFAAGLMPLVVQNGVWIDDAWTGVALSVPALNSPKLDISNMDFTFFAGFDKVSSKGVLDLGGNVADHNVNVYGLNTFIEANGGYWEAGYAYTDGEGKLSDQSYHNVTAAHTRRFQNWFSNSVRFIWNFGQHRDGDVRQNADGFLLLLENSLITSMPSTLVPYLNLFAGFDRPQSLARDAALGGVLKNTGINFETDNLTGFPKLDDTANNTYGGAIGVEYLFSLDQQIVVELATVQTMGNAGDRVAQGDQYAIGVRYQRPLDKAWIFRTDAMAADRENEENLLGVRVEIIRKF